MNEFEKKNFFHCNEKDISYFSMKHERKILRQKKMKFQGPKLIKLWKEFEEEKQFCQKSKRRTKMLKVVYNSFF